MKKYKVTSYTKRDSPKFPKLTLFSTRFATIEETWSFLGFRLRIISYEIYSASSLYWRYKDSGKYVPDELSHVLNAYEIYNNDQSN